MQLALIGLLGGLITGISPCVLPVLPVVLVSGTSTAQARTSSAGEPFLVVAGLVLSFSLTTLCGTWLIRILHLPAEAIRWAGLIALTVLGASLIVPRLREILERPFARIPVMSGTARARGFALGLALGTVYVPCAGPVLAAIAIAGATATITTDVILLTVGFAIGVAIPLLIFALAGRQIVQRIQAFRRHQRKVEVASGIVILVFAVALVWDLPAALQRRIPDYTQDAQALLAGNRELNQTHRPSALNALPQPPTAAAPLECLEGAPQLQDCGAAPDLVGISEWLNTPDQSAITLADLRGKVVLVDFWAYSCINCQRAITHVTNWYDTYKDSGFVVIGVHTPEYAFEHDAENVAAATRELGIRYPVALDNDDATWRNYRNHYWPAEYLIDGAGNVRHIAFGEGGYAETEALIRQLLAATAGHPQLPDAKPAADATPTTILTRESYLGAKRVKNFHGVGDYVVGTSDFELPPALPASGFGLAGRWTIGDEAITAAGPHSVIDLKYYAKNVFLVVGGTGTLDVSDGERTTTIAVSGPPTLRQIASASDAAGRELRVRLSPGLQAYSFTFG